MLQTPLGQQHTQSISIANNRLIKFKALKGDTFLL